MTTDRTKPFATTFSDMEPAELAAYIADKYNLFILEGGTRATQRRFERLLSILTAKLGTDRNDALERVKAMLEE